MQKQLLQEMIEQNQLSCSFAFRQINKDTVGMRLTPTAASIGFIYRHIAETMNLFGFFFGVPTEVFNTTMNQQDHQKSYDLEESHQLLAKGYQMLRTLIEEQPDFFWQEEIETPFFGKISKNRLLAHILYHNSHHAGQISLTISRG